MLLFQSDLSFLPGIKPRPARHHFAFTTKSRLVQKGEGRRRRGGGEGSWSRESLRSTNDVSTRRERKTREGSLFLSFLLLRSARNGDRFRGGTKCGAASFGNGVNILAARQSGRRRQCSRGGASLGLGRGEMTGRRRGGRSRREQHSRTFYVCFPWQTFHGIPRRSAERAARKTNCLLPNRLFSSIYACIYDLLPLFLPEVERWETGQLFANPDAWHVRRTRIHSLLFLRRDNTRLHGCPRNFDRHFRDFRVSPLFAFAIPLFRFPTIEIGLRENIIPRFARASFPLFLDSCFANDGIFSDARVSCKKSARSILENEQFFPLWAAEDGLIEAESNRF